LKDNKTVVKEWLKDTKPKPFVLSSTSGIMTKTPVSNPVSNPIVPSRAEKSSNSSISLNSLSQENVSFIGLEKTKNREAQTSEPKNAGSKVNFIIASANESIYSVSQRYNLSVSEIFDYNPFLSLRKMKPGDKIFLINKDSIPSLQAMDIDPFHTKGPVSKVYLQTKDYSYGNSTGPSNANDSLLFKRGNIPPAVKNK
jgi:LysM repeat protein